MARWRQWNELTARQRRLVVLGATLDSVGKVAALADLRRRPAEGVRGPRWAWATAIALTGSAGVLPLAYLLLGRRTDRPAAVTPGC
jgi:hypothetical protein